MFSENAYMSVPDDKDTVIWKYMSRDKFTSLLHNKALYFCSTKKYRDKHEGSFSPLNMVMKSFVDNMAPISNYTDKKRAQNQIYRNNVHINCWHMNEIENIAMWDNYLDSKEGIAIKSTYNKFVDAVMNAPMLIFMGIVNYIDYDKNFIPYDEGLWANFLYKRKEFSYEKEIRAMFLLSHDVLENGILHTLVDTDLDILIEEVVISPYSSDEFYKEIVNTAKKYNLNCKISKSNLSKKPVF